jgi:transposase InsO family protein
VEAVRKWKHYLTGKHFKLITDQKSVAYMFDTKRHSKIKNDKVMRWRIELSMYDFDIVYRAGEENIPADALSRMKIMSLTIDKLYELHKSLCHPGVARMVHFVKSRNLPFSVEDVKRMTQACKECQECKPQYYSPEPSHLIKATQPFERLNLDFKGPLPSNDRCRFMLTIIDEYSRFPFAFPCEDISAQTVIRSLSTLFSVYDMPTFIHTDRGLGFMSSELKNFLLQKGISSSRTTSYNPVGNGQIERLNGTLWKTITLALKTKGLPTNCWQEVLLDALHSIRSLLCTATNTTPHERMFTYPRKSTSGVSVPSWLTTPGPVLLKRHVRKSKYDPFVDEVDLLEANPQYAHVRFPDGREDTVSIKHLAPSGNVEVLVDSADQPRSLSSAENHSEEIDPLQTGVETQSQGVESTLNVDHQPQPLRRSERLRKEPDRLVYV